MIDALLAAMTSIAAVVLIGCIWGLICNSRTYNQRMKLLHARKFDDPSYWNYAWEFDEVTYDDHFYCLMKFGNPRKLYGPLTQQIWN